MPDHGLCPRHPTVSVRIGQVLVGGSVVLAALVGNELAGWKDRRETPRIQTLSAHAPAETFGGDSS